MRHISRYAVAVGVVLGCSVPIACNTSPSEDQELFPLDPKVFIPELPRDETQVGAGRVTGEAPPQPIAFPHDRHVELAGLSCEYCHSAARHSIHAGVPETQTCVGCHLLPGDQIWPSATPELERVIDYWKQGQPIPWTRVHDLPDFARFDHSSHVRAGVTCAECHGQVETMAGVRNPETGEVEDTMFRVSTLQMGWCLECHGEHPQIDEIYGTEADLRRAELKDCLVCHQ